MHILEPSQNPTFKYWQLHRSTNVHHIIVTFVTVFLFLLLDEYPCGLNNNNDNDNNNILRIIRIVTIMTITSLYNLYMFI